MTFRERRFGHGNLHALTRWAAWILRVIAVGTGCCVSSNAMGAAGDNWVKVVAPQFTLYSPAKNKDALMVAEEFQQFIDALGGVLTVDTRRLPPLTIVIFSN